jgi:hypothetical protein
MTETTKRATSPTASPAAIAPRLILDRASTVDMGVAVVVVVGISDVVGGMDVVVVGGDGRGVGAPGVIDGVPAANAPIPEFAAEGIGYACAP